MDELRNTSQTSKPQEAFVRLASHQVFKSGKNQENLPETTERLVSTGLALALGPNVAKDPEAFKKMKASVHEKIIKNPEYRKKLENFISILETLKK